MDEFLYHRQKKERGFSVQDALMAAEESDNAIVIYEQEGKIYCSHSIEDGNALELLGMLELGKMMVIEQT